MRRKNRVTTHHIIPSSKADQGFVTNQQGNTVWLADRVHAGVHMTFSNETPQEQLRTWIGINLKVLSQEVRDKLWEIIQMPKDRFYEAKFLKK